MAGLALKNYLGSDEAARILCIEAARFRFLEVQCGDFLSFSRLDFPRSYSPGDLKILAAANRLYDEGVPPDKIKSHLAKMLAEPAGWDHFSSSLPVSDARSAPRLIAIASGKGGVGKSNIALSLGAQLLDSGLSIAVLDADFGVANVHLLAGLRIDRTLKDVVAGDCGLEDIVACAPGGPDIVPGSSGIFEMANLSSLRRQALLSSLAELATRYDALLVDAAAGVSGSVLDFVVMADFTIVVTTAETTAITDAYALIKLAFKRNPYCRIGVVVNRVKNTREGAAAMERLLNCTDRFLGRSLTELGYVWEDGRVRRAVNERTPFVIAYPESRASASIRKLSALLQQKNIISPRQGAEESSIDASTEGVIH
jgi:flagellar biosynthesis protein FlhG